MEPAIIRLHPADREFLRKAVRGLERPGRVIETLNIAGRPVEAMLKRLPERSARIVDRAVYSALNRALDWAVTSLDPEEKPTGPELDTTIPRISAVARAHTTTAAVLGGVSGIFGLAFLPFELPMTMAVMMRSIASIARDMGADLEVPETRLECISVLSLGGPSPADDATDSSYLTARVGLAFMLRDAGRFMAERSARQVSDALARGTAPEIADLLARVGSRFGYAVSDIASAQLVPVLGAIGGAAINGYFTNYFNRIALYHFGIRKLERLYGRELVEAAYREELANLPPTA